MDESDQQPAEAQSPEQSGLRDPMRAVAALGSSLLGLEALVLLLTIVPMRMMRIDHLNVAIGAVLVLTVAAVVFAARARRRWAWHGGAGIQIALLACGFFHWALAGVGVIFGLTWIYVHSVRNKLTKPPERN